MILQAVGREPSEAQEQGVGQVGVPEALTAPAPPVGAAAGTGVSALASSSPAALALALPRSLRCSLWMFLELQSGGAESTYPAPTPLHARLGTPLGASRAAEASPPPQRPPPPPARRDGE